MGEVSGNYDGKIKTTSYGGIGGAINSQMGNGILREERFVSGPNSEILKGW